MYYKILQKYLFVEANVRTTQAGTCQKSLKWLNNFRQQYFLLFLSIFFPLHISGKEVWGSHISSFLYKSYFSRPTAYVSMYNVTTLPNVVRTPFTSPDSGNEIKSCVIVAIICMLVWLMLISWITLFWFTVMIYLYGARFICIKNCLITCGSFYIS